MNTAIYCKGPSWSCNIAHLLCYIYAHTTVVKLAVESPTAWKASAPPRAGRRMHHWAEDESYRTPEPLWFGILQTKDLRSEDTVFKTGKMCINKGWNPKSTFWGLPTAHYTSFKSSYSGKLKLKLSQCYSCCMLLLQPVHLLGKLLCARSFRIYSKNLYSPGVWCAGDFAGVVKWKRLVSILWSQGENNS